MDFKIYKSHQNVINDNSITSVLSIETKSYKKLIIKLHYTIAYNGISLSIRP